MHFFLFRVCFPWTVIMPLSLCLPPSRVTSNHTYGQEEDKPQTSSAWDTNCEDGSFRVVDLLSRTWKPLRDGFSLQHCWVWRSILRHNMLLCSGHVALELVFEEHDICPSPTSTHITIQGVSCSCSVPSHLHQHLRIKLHCQDVFLFLLWPSTFPKHDWKQMRLSCCPCLDKTRWRHHYHYRLGVPPAHFLPISHHPYFSPCNHYRDGRLPHRCSSYFRHCQMAEDTHQGLCLPSFHVKQGPLLRPSLDVQVEPIILHIYSAHSKLLRIPHRTIRLFWNVSSAKSQRKIYSLVDAQSRRFWSTTYNPYALRNNYSIAPSPPSFRNKVVARFSWALEEAESGDLSGALDFSGAVLGLRTRNQPLAYLTVNTQKIKAGTYFFTHRWGFFYLIKGPSSDLHIPSSTYYLFYQQQSLSYLITIEFVHRCWYRFSIHLYLNRKGVRLKSYSEKDVEIHLFKSGPSFVPSSVYIAWFIPLQNPLLQHKWAFNLQCLGVEKEDLLWNATYSYRDRAKNAAHFITDLPFNPALYAGFIAQVNCTRIGQMRIILETKVSTYTSKVLKSTVDCLQRFCFLKRVKIQESHYTNPVLNYSKKVSFILSADVEVNCPEPRETHIMWQIYKVPDMKTGPDWSKPLNPPGVGKKDLLILNIPADSLDEGLYLFNLTITLITMDTLEKAEDYDSVFVRIRPNRLWAVIAGGDLQTVGFSDQWILNGSASSDPDAPQPFEGLTFTWYCSKQKTDYISMTLNETGKCHPHQADLKWTASSEPVQTVLPRTLQENATYYFRLVVHKGRRQAQAEQRVQVEPDAWLALNLTCIENCGRSVIPTERFCLLGKCLNCRRFYRPQFHWSLFSGNSSELQFDWASRTSTGRTNPYLCVKPWSLMHVAEFSFRLVLKVSLEGHEPLLYNYSFVVNTPPALGKCSLNPPTGIAFLTKFSVHCSGFRDQDLPLTYKVKVALDSMEMPIRGNSTLGTIVYFGDQSKSPPSFLPVGVPSKQYLLNLYVQVYDDLGAYSQITIPTTVHSPLKAKEPEAVLNKLHSLTGGTSAPIVYFLNSGNYFRAGYFIHMVASALNDLEVLPRLHSSKTKLREILLNHLAGIPTTNIMEANHVISSILQITQEIGEINRKSQLLVVQKLKDVTDGLRRHNRENGGSKEIYDLGTAILAGLSSVLKASLFKNPQSHRIMAEETMSVAEILADLLLQGKVPGEHETILETDDWNITLRKEEKQDISETFAKRRDCQNCFYPKMKQVEYNQLPDDAVISTVLYDFDKNPFFWSPSLDNINTRVAGFKMAGIKSNGNVIEIVPDVAEMILTRNEEKTAVFEMMVEHSQNFPEASGGFSFEVCRNSKDILIQIVTKLKLTFQVFIYVGLKLSHPPIAIFNVSHNMPVTSKTKNSTGDDCVFQMPYVFCLSQTLLKAIFRGSKAGKQNISIVFQSDHFLGDHGSQRLGLTLFTADCLYLDDTRTLWRQDKCHLGPQTTWQKLHCVCAGKRRTARTVDPPAGNTSLGDVTFLAGKVTVYPDPAEVRKIQLAQIQRNPVIILTVVFIFLTYILLAIWAMRKDKADVESRAHAIVLPDNDPFDKVCYLVTVYTGSRFRAGTTATVFIQLIGDQAVSDIHRLSHPGHVPFLRGSINTFLLTSKNDLGDIYCLQAWHDNAGSSPNWYLSRVKVENMYTKQSWMFICRKWLALDKDNGLIERVFVVVQPLAPLNKMDFFLICFAKDFADNHLWFSLFAHVCTGSFNRLQRLSCCLATLFCILLINMMFFKADVDQQMYPGQLQNLRFLIIGIQSAFISVPLQMIITALFKYSQKEPFGQQFTATQQKVCSHLTTGNLRNWKELLQKCYLLETTSKFPGSGFPDGSFAAASNPQNLAGPKNIRWRQRTKTRYNCTIPEGDANIISTEEEASEVGHANINFNNNYVKKEAEHQTRPLNTPSMLFFKRPQIVSWWNKYASWVLVLVISATSSFSIILYGTSQDYKTSLEWLAASAISLLVSMFFLQTLNILFFSALKSLHSNSCENIPWSIKETFLEIKLNEPSMNADDMRELHYDLVRMRGSKKYQPLEEDEITIFKKKEKIRHQAFVFLKDVLCHFVFLILILNIAYSMENTRSFYYNQDMKSKLSKGLFEVSKIKEIYLWLKEVFLELIHNPLKPNFLPDTWSKILGLPKMRQIRAERSEKECFYPHSFVNKFVISKSHCLHKYGVDEEDHRNYLGSWKNPVNESVVNHLGNFTGFTYHRVRDPWRYNSYGERNVYEAGGYTFNFYPKEMLSESMKRMVSLEENSWLDENTWALIVEMTTFNFDTDLFCSISVIFEVSHLGPINTTLWIHSYKLPIFKQLDRREKFVFILVAYILVFYIIDEFCVVEQQRLNYLKNVSNLINFGIKAVCCFFLLQLAFKFKLASSLIDLYLHQPNQYIPFHKVSFVDKTLRITLGFLAFLIVLKTLRYSRFFYDVRLAQRSILAALPGICSMALVVAVYFFVYMAFGYLVFGQYEWNYNMMTHSAQTVFSYCVSAFKDTAFRSNRALGGLFLASFMMVMICVLINLFQAVIMSAYEDMKQPVYEEPSDEAEVVNFLFHKFRRIWAFITFRQVSTTDTELFNRVLFGLPERKNMHHLGLKARKINGKKMVYLVI
ncbi:polycystin family receptor for egg jelly-like [Pituophis catenifer annectens]|uniref:polycystin family receptor for egg jelly-like n=1 Tax=Pituophis catenifer annectens TaxID=94852 RepID=UPI003993D82D